MSGLLTPQRLSGSASDMRRPTVTSSAAAALWLFCLRYFFSFFEAAPAEQMCLNIVLSSEQTQQSCKSGLNQLRTTAKKKRYRLYFTMELNGFDKKGGALAGLKGCPWSAGVKHNATGGRLGGKLCPFGAQLDYEKYEADQNINFFSFFNANCKAHIGSK